MKYLHEHYEEEKQKYQELTEEGAEAFISYYRDNFPDKYSILLKGDTQIEKVRQYSDYERFLIQSGYVGNCMLWWEQDNKWYTTDLTKAHKYTKAEIIDKISWGLRDEDKIWNASHIFNNTTQVCEGHSLNSKYTI